MKNLKDRWKIITLISVMVLVVMISMVVLLVKLGNKTIALEDGLVIIKIGSYDGKFVEDGTDEEVSDVLMIVVKNEGNETLQYAELNIEFENVKAEFDFSTLRPGEKMIVLEKNRLEYSTGMEVTSAKLENAVFFQEELSLCEDTIKISPLDGAMNIENISDNELSGTIWIYYKNKQGGRYLGGITYRATIEGGLGVGEIKQVMANHFSLENSEIMFVVCAP